MIRDALEGVNRVRPDRNATAVLFLDIDGVLNRTETRERNPFGSQGVERAKAAMLRRILEKTGAKIVISSTWRLTPGLMEYFWDQIGREFMGRCAGMTPDLANEQQGSSGARGTRGASLFLASARGQEIQAWLDEHPEVSRFVIVDDNADMGRLTPHLIQTNFREGLTERITERITARLGR